MLISPYLPTLRGSIVQHMRRLVIDADIRELESKPEHILTVMGHLHSAPIALVPTMSVNLQRSPQC